MKIGDEYRLTAIGMKDFLVVARRISLDSDWAEQRVDEIGNGLVRAFSEAAAEVASPFAREVVRAISARPTDRGSRFPYPQNP